MLLPVGFFAVFMAMRPGLRLFELEAPSDDVDEVRDVDGGTYVRSDESSGAVMTDDVSI